MKYLNHVHITQGTESTRRFSSGNTLPLTQLPWGMAGFIPQTQTRDDRWLFYPHDRTLEGVRLTHQPSPWVGDFGSLILLPQNSVPHTSPDARWSGYRPKEAILKPHYLKLEFLRSRSVFELSPTERGAIIRIKYDVEAPFFSLIATDHAITARFDRENNRIIGSTDSHMNPVQKGFRLYFVLDIEGEFSEKSSIIDGDSAIHIALNSKEITARLATSFISEEQALLNLQQELSGKSFDDVKNEGAERWESLLSRVEIESEDADLYDTFYSCLYRSFLYPNKMYELDASGNPIHYDSHNDEVRSGIVYTNNGFWDTYRTIYPFYSIVAPNELKEILEGYITLYKNTGWLPKWPSCVEMGYMPGTLIDAVIADAAVKGILTGENLKHAFDGMLKHATTKGSGTFGRNSIEEYLQYGYVPRDVAKESVNYTMDFAYGDYCIARVAEMLGEDKIAEDFDKRADNYKHLFDPTTGFMRGKDKEGEMAEIFDEFGWGGEYTEGGPWQSSFAVYHDFDGLAELHGGKDKLIEKLEKVFETKPLYSVGGYEVEIHEMTEMAAVDFGQCAISNQPSFHYPWLFSLLGKPELTEYWVRKLALEAFSWRPDGFPGDEDNGTTASWYIFAVLGFYPVCPGKPEYVKGVPLAKSIKINGKSLDLSTYGNVVKHENVI